MSKNNHDEPGRSGQAAPRNTDSSVNTLLIILLIVIVVLIGVYLYTDESEAPTTGDSAEQNSGQLIETSEGAATATIEVEAN